MNAFTKDKGLDIKRAVVVPDGDEAIAILLYSRTDGGTD